MPFVVIASRLIKLQELTESGRDRFYFQSFTIPQRAMIREHQSRVVPLHPRDVPIPMNRVLQSMMHLLVPELEEIIGDARLMSERIADDEQTELIRASRAAQEWNESQRVATRRNESSDNSPVDKGYYAYRIRVHPTEFPKHPAVHPTLSSQSDSDSQHPSITFTTSIPSSKDHDDVNSPAQLCEQVKGYGTSTTLQAKSCRQVRGLPLE